jgi:hypothetical protein
MTSSVPSGLEDVFYWLFLLTIESVHASIGLWESIWKCAESGPAVAHNGVRHDDDVDERVARKQPNHQSDEEEET